MRAIINLIYGLCVAGFIIAAIIVISLFSGGFAWILRIGIIFVVVLVAVIWMLDHSHQQEKRK